MSEVLLREFQIDWKLSGKAHQTVGDYSRYVKAYLSSGCEVSLVGAKTWLESTESVSTRRKYAQALRAFGKWCCENEYEGFEWWIRLPLAPEQQRIQRTVGVSDVNLARQLAKTKRDRALVEVLWSTGLRRSEIARAKIEDIDFAGGLVIVPQSKNGQPRVAPLSTEACKAIRRHLSGRTSGSLFEMTGNAIMLRLRSLGIANAHAWRRGWAVESLRRGVSEASVKVAAGWSSGAMVSRYTAALSSELAVAEFQKMRP